MQDTLEILDEVGTTYEEAIIKLYNHLDIKKDFPFEKCYIS